MLLRIENLHVGYGDITVLKGVTLGIQERQVIAVLGRNGIGKTTLVKSLAGLISAKAGQITLDGKDLTTLTSPDRVRLGMGYVPQGREIFPNLTVRENLLVGLHALGLPLSRMDEILEDFPALVPKLRQLGGGLSGGQQQLLALARALVLNPKVLLLDEPSEGIQPSILDEITDFLLHAKEKSGLAILLVEQNLDFTSALADRAYLLDEGGVSREIDPNNLLADPALLQEFIGTSGEPA